MNAILDALELDSELIASVQDKFFNIFGFLPSTTLIERLGPELKALLTFLEIVTAHLHWLNIYIFIFTLKIFYTVYSSFNWLVNGVF